MCVGLDPHRQLLPEDSAATAAAWCRQIVAETAEHAAAFKVNAAFFEVFGADGWRAMAQVIGETPEEIPVIVDAKRADISSTAAAYADAIFDGLGADAVTVNPYLGVEAIAPFRRDGKAVFVLVRTSNPGGADLQEQELAAGQPLFARVVELFRGPDIGYVVGATSPGVLASVRRTAPDAWILAPGVGAQAADLATAVAAGKRLDGSGLLVPVSRAIAEAPDRRTAAAELRRAINAVNPEPPHDGIAELAAVLHDSGCIRFGDFTLKSGERSPLYIDLRRLASFPDALAVVARQLATLLATIPHHHLAAIPHAALPIGTAVSLRTGAGMIYPRHQAKEYGTKAEIEGAFAPGERAVVLDDLATSGASKFAAVERLREAGLEVTDVVVVIDRGGGEAIRRAGLRFHAVVTARQLIDELLRQGSVTAADHARALDYLSE